MMDSLGLAIADIPVIAPADDTPISGGTVDVLGVDSGTYISVDGSDTPIDVS